MLYSPVLSTRSLVGNARTDRLLHRHEARGSDGSHPTLPLALAKVRRRGWWSNIASCLRRSRCVQTLAILRDVNRGRRSLRDGIEPDGPWSMDVPAGACFTTLMQRYPFQQQEPQSQYPYIPYIKSYLPSGKGRRQICRPEDGQTQALRHCCTDPCAHTFGE